MYLSFVQLISYDKDQKYGGLRTCEVMDCPEDFPFIYWMERSYGRLAVIEQKRDTWKLANVAIHLDTITDLGTFVEIEAMQTAPNVIEEMLKKQCEIYLDQFRVCPEEIIQYNYGELMAMENKG
jgi:hypothetical protein